MEGPEGEEVEGALADTDDEYIHDEDAYTTDKYVRLIITVLTNFSILNISTDLAVLKEITKKQVQKANIRRIQKEK